jgi:peptidoglycan/xylan/chitin deacetylase (PgdA/CDA1 family)
MRILGYHEINDNPSDPIHGVSVTAFRQQMQWLADNGYTVAHLGQKASRPKTVCLVFDDGYLDTFTQVWPILREHGFAATAFLISSLVGSDVQWESAWKAAPLMTWEQIREMSQEGIQFGSHSHTHPDLTAISGQQLDNELRLSRQIIEAKLDREITLFSFPFSRMNRVVAERVYAAGYRFAFSFSPFYPGTRRVRYGVLPATGILSYDDLVHFRHKVQGSLSRWLHWRARQVRILVRQRRLPKCYQ